MKPLRIALAAITLMFAQGTLAASAAQTYVFDSANLLQPATVEALNTRIEALKSSLGKEVVVDIVDTTGGQTPRDFAASEFQKHSVNGVMIFVSKTPKSVGVIGDRASTSIFPAGSFDTIRASIRSSFRDRQYDEGITNGVGLVINTYRSHAGALQERPRMRHVMPANYVHEERSSGPNWLWIILIGGAIFLIIRAVTRASSGGGYGGPGYGGGAGPGYGGPGYGGPGPGYGGGFGGGGGGGGFFSSMLGGLGGAFLGNELFNSMNRNNENGFNQQNMMGQNGGGEQGADQGSYDQGAFQNDAGQADMGNSSFGDWGDSGGGGGGSGGGDDTSSW